MDCFAKQLVVERVLKENMKKQCRKVQWNYLIQPVHLLLTMQTQKSTCFQKNIAAKLFRKCFSVSDLDVLALSLWIHIYSRTPARSLYVISMRSDQLYEETQKVKVAFIHSCLHVVALHAQADGATLPMHIRSQISCTLVEDLSSIDRLQSL